jgi:hypothetical protein
VKLVNTSGTKIRKIDEPETHNMIKYNRNFYRCINDFKKGYQRRTNMVKDEKGDLVTDSQSTECKWS